MAQCSMKPVLTTVLPTVFLVNKKSFQLNVTFFFQINSYVIRILDTTVIELKKIRISFKVKGKKPTQNIGISPFSNKMWLIACLNFSFCSWRYFPWKLSFVLNLYQRYKTWPNVLATTLSCSSPSKEKGAMSWLAYKRVYLTQSNLYTTACWTNTRTVLWKFVLLNGF